MMCLDLFFVTIDGLAQSRYLCRQICFHYHCRFTAQVLQACLISYCFPHSSLSPRYCHSAD